MRKALISIVLVLLLICGGFWFFFPLQVAELSNRYEFWRGGVTEIQAGGLHAYTRDTCQHAPQSKGCTCVVMIHGLADNALTWKKILLWPDNGWAEPVKLFAFDLPGSGGSPAPTDLSDYRVRKQALRLKEALAPLCTHWVVAGNSMGGWIAAWLALDWREGVSKLLLLDAAGMKSGVNPEELKSYFAEPTVESMKEFQRRAYFKGREIPDHVWRAVVGRMKSSNSRQIMTAQTPEDFLDDRLPALRRPTFLLWGAADRITPVTSGQLMQSLIPGSIWQLVPECGHLPQKECPVDVIKALNGMITYGGV